MLRIVSRGYPFKGVFATSRLLIEEELKFMRHNSVAAAKNYMCADGIREANRFRALGIMPGQKKALPAGVTFEPITEEDKKPATLPIKPKVTIVSEANHM